MMPDIYEIRDPSRIIYEASLRAGDVCEIDPGTFTKDTVTNKVLHVPVLHHVDRSCGDDSLIFTM